MDEREEEESNGEDADGGSFRREGVVGAIRSSCADDDEDLRNGSLTHGVKRSVNKVQSAFGVEE